MEILNLLNNSRIEDIPLLELEDRLSKLRGLRSESVILIDYNNRTKNIKCIREYYLDPNTNKKMPKVNIVNACPIIQRSFGVKCSTNDCRRCHMLMIEQYFKNEASLIKGNKK